MNTDLMDSSSAEKSMSEERKPSCCHRRRNVDVWNSVCSFEKYLKSIRDVRCPCSKGGSSRDFSRRHDISYLKNVERELYTNMYHRFNKHPVHKKIKFLLCDCPSVACKLEVLMSIKTDAPTYLTNDEFENFLGKVIPTLSKLMVHLDMKEFILFFKKWLKTQKSILEEMMRNAIKAPSYFNTDNLSARSGFKKMTKGQIRSKLTNVKQSSQKKSRNNLDSVFALRDLFRLHGDLRARHEDVLFFMRATDFENRFASSNRYVKESIEHISNAGDLLKKYEYRLAEAHSGKPNQVKKFEKWGREMIGLLCKFDAICVMIETVTNVGFRRNGSERAVFAKTPSAAFFPRHFFQASVPGEMDGKKSDNVSGPSYSANSKFESLKCNKEGDSSKKEEPLNTKSRIAVLEFGVDGNSEMTFNLSSGLPEFTKNAGPAATSTQNTEMTAEEMKELFDEYRSLAKMESNQWIYPAGRGVVDAGSDSDSDFDSDTDLTTDSDSDSDSEDTKRKQYAKLFAEMESTKQLFALFPTQEQLDRENNDTETKMEQFKKMILEDDSDSECYSSDDDDEKIKEVP